MRRKPLGYKSIDPRRSTIFLDSCAFDQKYSPEDKAANQIFQLYRKDELILNIAHSTQKEIEHPNTPTWVKREAMSFIYTIPTSLTTEELARKAQILNILAGKGDPERMRKDADHIFEANKYGGYFITVDGRILKKKEAIEEICSATIVKPSEFLKIVEIYQNT